MEHLTKALAEAQSALTQVQSLMDENKSLRAEIAASPNATPQDIAKVALSAFKAGQEEVLSQLQGNTYSTTREIEESCWSDGFEVSFCKEVDIDGDVDDVLEELYDPAGSEEMEEACVELVTEYFAIPDAVEEEEEGTNANHQS